MTDWHKAKEDDETREKTRMIIAAYFEGKRDLLAAIQERVDSTASQEIRSWFAGIVRDGAK